jgi:2-polyprenyl-6-methoxyphenol hydroxylase-like FAD-dependent oxidoreductase
LEKETEIDEDPRGVFLAGDAIRVLYQIGIGDQMAVIGKGEWRQI